MFVICRIKGSKLKRNAFNENNNAQLSFLTPKDPFFIFSLSLSNPLLPHSLYRSIYLFIYVALSLFPLSVSLSVSISLSPLLCLCLYLSTFLSVYLSISLSVCLKYPLSFYSLQTTSTRPASTGGAQSYPYVVTSARTVTLSILSPVELTSPLATLWVKAECPESTESTLITAINFYV